MADLTAVCRRYGYGLEAQNSEFTVFPIDSEHLEPIVAILMWDGEHQKLADFGPWEQEMEAQRKKAWDARRESTG